ncbi:MAG TPA: glycosyltransferase, partial [Tepidisphaeraceae bacterium]
ETSIPPDIDFLPRPILGWFGVVDERVDYHLLAEVARMHRNWSIAVVGPVVKIDPNLLPHAPNLHWLGGRDYSVLPNYCRAFDVNMMAFAINKATEFINPTKALEYMATGKPIVSTPVKDVVRQYTDIVSLANTPEQFAEAAWQALSNPDPKKIQAGLDLAKKNSWEGHVASMRGNIKDAINVSGRRSSNITPMPDPEPGYFFKHTQGS